MILGAFPLGAVPVGAGAAFVITPVAVGGRATLSATGELRIKTKQSTGAKANLVAQAYGSLNSVSSIKARTSLWTTSHGLSAQVSHVQSRAMLFTEARGLSVQGPSHIRGRAELFSEARGRLTQGPSHVRGRAALFAEAHGLVAQAPFHIGGRANNSTALASGRSIAPFHLSGRSRFNTITKAGATLGITSSFLPIFPILPPLAWSVHKKPIGASRVTTGVTGRDNQLAGAVYPRWAFTLTYGGNSWLRERTQNIVPDPTKGNFVEFEQLSSIFIVCSGPAGEFLYEDPDDNSRSRAAVGRGNGTTTTFPIMVPWGTGPFVPNFTMPVGAVNTLDAVYFNGIVQNVTTYFLDAERRQLSFLSAPASGVTITADFHFYFRCRFLDDHLDFSQWAKNLWECREVRFESVKL